MGNTWGPMEREEAPDDNSKLQGLSMLGNERTLGSRLVHLSKIYKMTSFLDLCLEVMQSWWGVALDGDVIYDGFEIGVCAAWSTWAQEIGTGMVTMSGKKERSKRVHNKFSKQWSLEMIHGYRTLCPCEQRRG